jgi:Ca-activated chloride channel family protein
MIRTLIPLTLATVTLAGTAAVTANASDGTDAACPRPDVTEGNTPSTTDADPPTDRCAIDAEGYYLNYGSGDNEHATTTASAPGPSATTAGMPGTADAAMEEVGPPAPPPWEPGPLDDNTFVDAGDSTWVETESDRESTFALDVDTGSFNVAQTFLANGYRPEPDSIRPEEWVNSFTYGDPAATDDDLAVHIESDFDSGDEQPTALVRIGVTSREIADEDRPPANITFVIDTSGSMDIRERLGLVQSSLALLVRSLRPDDTIAIVTYGDDAWPVLPPTPVAEWEDIVDAIDSLGPGGSTNMEAGLTLGYEQARESHDPDALNVVVLASDGVANVGVTDADVLTDQITQAGEEGIHLVTVGYGMGNYNDYLMEQLANMGDGFYAYVDRFHEAVDLFVDNLTPTLTVVAEEAKIQVVFDAAIVARYRLIGYENRMLDDEEFTDDTVDAGEIGAGHQVSALYEVKFADGAILDGADAEPLPALGEVRLRWRSTHSGEVIQLDESLLVDGDGPSQDLRFAALVGYTAEVLKGNSVVSERGITLEELLAEADALDEVGVAGAATMAELIAVAMSAEDPIPSGE